MATRGRKKEGLSPSEHSVLLLCAQHAEGMSISKKSLAAAIGKCDRTAARALRYLKNEGLIESIPQQAEDGTTLVNLYVATDKGRECLKEETE